MENRSGFNWVKDYDVVGIHREAGTAQNVTICCVIIHFLFEKGDFVAR